ncbi:MAG TPA: hypothetical protein VFP63_08840 [Dehalococcoidia bacterium]|nr:hypothetical protein [Dehalococcoidia bacterium]
MSWTVSPRQFVEVFDRVVARNEGELLGLWEDVKGYSAYLLKGPQSILRQVASQLEVRYLGREFLGTDAAYLPDDGSGRVSVVIEHENVAGTARYEVYKLAHLSVPLRVLITYPFELGKDQERLHGYCDILEELGANASGQLLIVFATRATHPDTSIRWRYHLFAGSEFLEINPRRPVIDV